MMEELAEAEDLEVSEEPKEPMSLEDHKCLNPRIEKKVQHALEFPPNYGTVKKPPQELELLPLRPAYVDPYLGEPLDFGKLPLPVQVVLGFPAQDQWMDKPRHPRPNQPRHFNRNPPKLDMMGVKPMVFDPGIKMVICITKGHIIYWPLHHAKRHFGLSERSKPEKVKEFIVYKGFFWTNMFDAKDPMPPILQLKKGIHNEVQPSSRFGEHDGHRSSEERKSYMRARRMTLIPFDPGKTKDLTKRLSTILEDKDILRGRGNDRTSEGHFKILRVIESARPLSEDFPAEGLAFARGPYLTRPALAATNRTPEPSNIPRGIIRPLAQDPTEATREIPHTRPAEAHPQDPAETRAQGKTRALIATNEPGPKLPPFPPFPHGETRLAKDFKAQPPPHNQAIAPYNESGRDPHGAHAIEPSRDPYGAHGEIWPDLAINAPAKGAHSPHGRSQPLLLFNAPATKDTLSTWDIWTSWRPPDLINASSATLNAPATAFNASTTAINEGISHIHCTGHLCAHLAHVP